MIYINLFLGKKEKKKKIKLKLPIFLKKYNLLPESPIFLQNIFYVESKTASFPLLPCLLLFWLDAALIENRTNTGSRSASHRKKRAGPQYIKRGHRDDL